VEKGGLSDQRVQVDTSRMIVTGNAAFLTDKALTEAGIDFVLSGLNWLLNRTQLIGIAPKEEKQFTLNLTSEQLRNIALLVLGVIPGAAAVLGLASWISHRR